MSVPTYSLTPKVNTEKSYYRSVEELTTEVMVETTKLFQPIINSIPTVCPEQVCLEFLLLGIYARRGSKTGETPTLAHLDQNLDHLQQSNDYTYQTEKLRSWQQFIMALSPPFRTQVWELIICSTNWFAKRSSEVLGVFTAHVNSFLADFKPSDRPDTLFCTSPVLEYHLNMVGAEILNRLWRKSFQETEKQLLVLPGCLRSDPKACLGKEWTLGFKCNHCSRKCQVKELSELGEIFGFHVSFVKHQSSLVSHVQSLDKLVGQCRMGILGVACTLSLLEGGFMLEAHKVPGQCIPLDFCGCTSHWHRQGLTTSVSVERVLEIMNRF